MDPLIVEFLAENENVNIIPSFNEDKLDLICGTVGPFRAGRALTVPIWLAVNFKSRQKCRIVPPDWMDVDILNQLLETENRNEKAFCEMPNDHYIVIAQILMRVACDDIPRAETIRTILKDIWDKRQAKLRRITDEFLQCDDISVRLDNVTSMEINSVRHILPQALDFIKKIRKTGTQTTPFSSSFSSGSYGHYSSATRPS